MTQPKKKRTQAPPLSSLFPSLDEMSPYERVWGAVHGEEIDRPPVCFWHHFTPFGSGRRLAEATAEFFDFEYELDIAKIMPDIPYPFPAKSVTEPHEWLKLEPLDNIRSRYFTERALAVQHLRSLIGADMPIVMTVFNPLHELLASAASPEVFTKAAKQAPTVLHEVLHTLAENIRAHNQIMISAGVDGIFFALQGCTRAVMGEDLYREFGRPYDLAALKGAEGGWLNILHVHGEKDLLLDLVLDYPVSVLSWSDRIAGPSLRDIRSHSNKTLMGGWNEFGAIAKGDTNGLKEEARDAMKQTGGKKFILAPGCSVPDDINPRHLKSARAVADALGS
jgi:uroporphyrinogen decarboxylase